MSRTGATDEQLLAACERNAELNGYTRGDSNILDTAYFGRGNRLTEMAGLIVPPTHRIVSVEDLKTLTADVISVAEWRKTADRIIALINHTT